MAGMAWRTSTVMRQGRQGGSGSDSIGWHLRWWPVEMKRGQMVRQGAVASRQGWSGRVRCQGFFLSLIISLIRFGVGDHLCVDRDMAAPALHPNHRNSIRGPIFSYPPHERCLVSHPVLLKGARNGFWVGFGRVSYQSLLYEGTGGDVPCLGKDPSRYGMETLESRLCRELAGYPLACRVTFNS